MVRLIPFHADAIVQMVQWAEREDMKDFFRRVPPVMEWCNVERAMTLFGAGYLVTLEGNIVGYVVLSGHDPFGKSVELSAMVDPLLVPKGQRVGTEAAVLLTNYAFDTMHCAKVYTKTLASRTQLCKSLVAHGFRIEGKLRKSIDGQDELLLGLLKEEYRRLQ